MVSTMLRVILVATALVFPVFPASAAETITVYKNAT